MFIFIITFMFYKIKIIQFFLINTLNTFFTFFNIFLSSLILIKPLNIIKNMLPSKQQAFILLVYSEESIFNNHPSKNHILHSNDYLLFPIYDLDRSPKNVIPLSYLQFRKFYILSRRHRKL